MVTVKQLCEAIANVLYEEKSYNLPRVCEELGLAPGTEQEAFSSKMGYVLRRLSEKDERFVREVAYKVLDQYDSTELHKILGEFVADSHQLTAGINLSRDTLERGAFHFGGKREIIS